jgi:MFS family permease
MPEEAGRSMGVWQRYGAALRYSDYRRFWLSASLAGGAVWGLIVARGWLAFQASDGSSLAVGMTTFAAMIPFVLVPPFSGLLADRMDRRHLIAIAHTINVLLALALAALWYVGTVSVWHLVLFSFLSGVARGVQLPASTAFVPNLVPREDLLNAIALNNISLQGSRLLGPALVAVMLGTPLEVGGAFLMTALMYAIAAVTVLMVRTSATGALESGASFLSNLAAGVVYAYRVPSVGLMLTLVALHCGLTMAFESVLPLHAQDALHAGGVAFTNLVSAFGAGAVIGVVAIAGIRDDRTKGRALLVTALGSSAAAVLLAYSPSLSLALGASFLMGLTQAPFMSLSTTFIQAVAPDNIRGRVSSLFTMSALSLMAIANLGYGALADAFGSVVVLAVPSLVFIGVMVAVLLGVGILRGILLRGFSAAAPAPAPVPTGGAS